jgi:hypothetical protein
MLLVYLSAHGVSDLVFFIMLCMLWIFDHFLSYCLGIKMFHFLHGVIKLFAFCSLIASAYTAVPGKTLLLIIFTNVFTRNLSFENNLNSTCTV